MKNSSIPKLSLEKIETVVFGEDDSEKTFEHLVRTLDLLPAEDFRHVDLADVDFGKADLTGFDFSFSDLRNANFTQATIRNTIFAHAKIAGAKWPEGFVPDTESNPEREFAKRISEIKNFLPSNDRSDFDSFAAFLSEKKSCFVSGIPNWIDKCGLDYWSFDQFLDEVRSILEGAPVVVTSEGPFDYLRLTLGADYAYMTPKQRDLYFDLSRNEPSVRTKRIRQKSSVPDPAKIVHGAAPVPLSVAYLYVLATVRYVTAKANRELYHKNIWEQIFRLIRIYPAIYGLSAETRAEMRSLELDLGEPKLRQEVKHHHVLSGLINGGFITSKGIEFFNSWLASKSVSSIGRKYLRRGITFSRVRDLSMKKYFVADPLMNEDDVFDVVVQDQLSPRSKH